jgi:hypothetical protein
MGGNLETAVFKFVLLKFLNKNEVFDVKINFSGSTVIATIKKIVLQIVILMDSLQGILSKSNLYSTLVVVFAISTSI